MSNKKNNSEEEIVDDNKEETTEEVGTVKPSKKPDLKVKSKKTFSLDDYKKEKGTDTVGFKPNSWIKMSPAFQRVTGLPGIIEGGISMCHGKSNTGKSTMALELAKYAQEQNILPVFIITEKKWSWERCEEMGINADNCLINTDIDFIEQGCDFIEEILKDQVDGKLPRDVVFIWDSIGSTPSKREFDNAESGSGGNGMMVAAKILRERISRRIFHKINNTRKESYPFNATLLLVTQSYITPSAYPGGQPSITATGGEGIIYASSLVFRFGGIMSSSSKIKATKDGVQVSFAVKSALVVEKNHITNSSPDGKVVCTGKGFIDDTKEAIDEYKKNNKADWNLEFDKDWDRVTKE